MPAIKRNEEKERAKQIILEIIRQAGGVLNYKTSLFKAFYHAHLRFADTQATYLSAWPIVRMPRGPGIDQFDILLGELMAEGRVETKQVESGDCRGFQFKLSEKTPDRSLLPKGAMSAIRYGVAQVKGKSATQASDESHRMSRAWRESRDGEELNIYLDSLSDEEYRDHMESARRLKKALISAWAD